MSAVETDEDYRQGLWTRWHARTDEDSPVIREEWLLTSDDVGDGFPPYRFVFGGPGEAVGEIPTTPEERARAFVAMVEKHGGWPDPPRLRSRIIIETEWVDE